jgi:Glycosyl hydrolase 108
MHFSKNDSAVQISLSYSILFHLCSFSQTGKGDIEMASYFHIDQLIDDVIGREGGYSNHPADRGGATRWGVTEAVARAHGYRGDMRSGNLSAALLDQTLL